MFYKSFHKNNISRAQRTNMTEKNDHPLIKFHLLIPLVRATTVSLVPEIKRKQKYKLEIKFGRETIIFFWRPFLFTIT